MLTEPKTALAGVTLDISFAGFKVSMTIFNADIAVSRSLGCWDLHTMLVAETHRCVA